MAYSLLGIFSIYLPLIYGEGKEYVFKRLKMEIQNLLISEYILNYFIFRYLLITLYKKPTRTYLTLKLKAIYKIYK
jgi:hypothetical protein